MIGERVPSLSTSLLGVLRRVTGDAGLVYDGEPVPLTGGFWAELVSFRLADPPTGWAGELVARVMPDAATGAKETVFQAEVADQAFATPRVLASGGPAEGVDGRAFMVMTLAEGKPLLSGLDGVGALAPAAYDLGFTSLVVASPPLVVPSVLRPVVRAAGRALSRRFVRAYERASGGAVDRSSLAWHQGVVCLRALVEVAHWVAAGQVEERRGHPWLVSGPAFATRLSALTGTAVTYR